MTHAKRSFSNTSGSSTTSSGGVLGGPLSPSVATSSSMKKAKSQQAGPASEREKNGLHAYTERFEAEEVAVVDEEESMFVDQEELKGGSASAAAIATTGVASNLSRKKATPPQPSSKKQLVIKLVKGKPTLPANFEENTWATLKSAITAIFLKQPDPCDSEKLYQAVSDLCLHKMGGNLYQRIQQECEGHISAKLHSLVGQSLDLVVFLSLVEKCWQDFCDQMLMIRGIALYLDRTHVKQTPNVRSLWDMGLQLFRRHLSLSPEVERKIVAGLLELIERERLGKCSEGKLGHGGWPSGGYNEHRWVLALEGGGIRCRKTQL